jgi:hypothetical protein
MTMQQRIVTADSLIEYKPTLMKAERSGLIDAKVMEKMIGFKIIMCRSSNFCQNDSDIIFSAGGLGKVNEVLRFQ